MRKDFLVALFIVALAGCNSPLVPKGDDDDAKKDVSVHVTTKDPLQLLSDAKYSLDNMAFKELAPVFEDGHITGFGMAIYQMPLISPTVEDGFFQTTINLKAGSAGSLYFNLDSDAEGTLKDALRIELYQESMNKAVIYSYEGGESITEAEADLNADGQPGKDMNGETIMYTNGAHSYMTKKFNQSAFSNLNENEEISLRATIFFDGFQTNTESFTKNINKLDLSFELK